MKTKERIIQIADKLLLERGYNAFSFKNISIELGIKTSSIHYHFPTKTDLGIAIIHKHDIALTNTILKLKHEAPVIKLEKLIIYYKKLALANKVCIVGALTSSVNTLDKQLQKEVLSFANKVIDWTQLIIEEGQQKKQIKQFSNSHIKAKMIIAELMAFLQLTRISHDKTSFDDMTYLLKEELLVNKINL
ncbi:TetR/AcrR family transcriptional regulator [Tenacibaculum sp. IB213877]|uniref:TetR/AcrR family transcriptional regulator n=1 Tax=Tenacibaculum sp. IB213877 TaxID=3097351 RepID=UPI002A5A8096|nr:TetR/AcrR family transcriptional regulator [Tenacibaculum sp. IB213877]MDY0779834.1 TetR/AcrR family transcriptional regulator [Tenacibaculum sp. IB213877]